MLFAKPPIGSRSKSVNRFFEISAELEREQATRREVTNIELDPSPLLDMVRRAKKQLNELSTFSNLIRRTGLSPDEKAKRIESFDQRKTVIARQVVKAVEKRQSKFRIQRAFREGRGEAAPDQTPVDDATKSRVTRAVRAFMDAPNIANRKAMNEALREGSKIDPELRLRAQSLVIREVSNSNLSEALIVFNEMTEADQAAFMRELGESEEGLQLRARLFQESRKRRGR